MKVLKSGNLFNDRRRNQKIRTDFLYIYAILFQVTDWLINLDLISTPAEKFYIWRLGNHVYGLIWYGLVLWYINHWWFFNARSIFVHINSSIRRYSVWHKNTVLFNSTYTYDPIRCNPSVPEWTCKRLPWRELSIPQSSSITGASPSDCFVSYPSHLWGKTYLSAEKQSMYSTATANGERVHE